MTGSASGGWTLYFVQRSDIPEEGFGEEIHVGITLRTRLADDGKRL